MQQTSDQRETRSFAFEFKAGENGEIEGYGSVFGVKDSYDDVIVKGAFAKSIKSHRDGKSMPAMLWQHDPAEPIGVWTDMSEDENGLHLKGQLVLETTRGREAHALMRRGALNGLSIGFMAKAWDYDRASEVRTLTEIDLWEVSVVTFPANSKARVTGVKSIDTVTTPADAERLLREAGSFSKSEATALVSRLLRMGEERREAAQSTAQALKAASRLLSSLTHS